MERLSGKNILITGASQGLGREMALRFGREGAAGLSLVARHGDEVSKVCDEVRKLAPKTDIIAIEADVSKRATSSVLSRRPWPNSKAVSTCS